MLDEITKDIKATLYDRIASPLTGSLIISWIYWNWEILVVLFFESSEVLGCSKIDYVNTFLIDRNYIVWLPLLSAGIITLFYPLVSTGAYWVWQQFQRIKRTIKIKSEDKVPLDIGESIELRLQIRKMQQTFHESNQANTSMIHELQNENNNLKAQIAEQKEVVNQKNALQKEWNRLNLEFKNKMKDLKRLENQEAKIKAEHKELSEQSQEINQRFNSLIQENDLFNSDFEASSDLALMHEIHSKGRSLENYDINSLEKLISMGLVAIRNRRTGKYPYLTQKGKVIYSIFRVDFNKNIRKV